VLLLWVASSLLAGVCLRTALVAALELLSLHSNSIATAGLVTELLGYPIGNAELLGYLTYKPVHMGSHGTDVTVSGSLDIESGSSAGRP
jgi:hypothetical protein